MAKRAVALRLDPEMLEWVDGHAKERGVSRQVVLEHAVASFRVDVTGAVPDLSGGAVRVAGRSGPPVGRAPGPSAGASVSVPAVPDRHQVGFSRAEAFRGAGRG